MLKNRLAAVVLAVLAPIPVAQAGTAVRLDTQGLVDRAELVLEGRVLAERPFLAANGLVHTEYLVRCDRTFWGAPQAERSVTLPGGVLVVRREQAWPADVQFQFS